MNPRGILRSTRERMQSAWAVVFWVVSIMSPLLGAEKANIALSDGTVLKAARIVSIGKTSVAIVHEGGVASVSPEEVPLDVLAKAQMELPSPVRTAQASTREEARTRTGAKESSASALKEARAALALAKAQMEPHPQQPARLGEPEKVTAVETAEPLSLQAPRDPISSETYIPEKASGSKIESESAAGGKRSSDVHRTQAKESRSTLQKAVGAAIDSPKLTILFTAMVVCGSLIIFSMLPRSSPVSVSRPIIVIVPVACLCLFWVYLWERPPPPPPAPETPETKRTLELNMAYISGQRDAEKGRLLTAEQMVRLGMDAEVRYHYRAGYQDKTYSK